MEITFPRHSVKGKAPKPIEYYINENNCWIYTSHRQSHNGYPEMCINTKRARMSHYIYRRFRGKIPENHIIMHVCDSPTCINPNHLKAGTILENIQDKVDKGRQARGEKQRLAKLTEGQILAIRADTRSLRLIAKDYNIDYTHVSAIKRRKVWKHI
jgi:hypothetical protein